MGNTPKYSRVEDLQSTDDVHGIPTSDTIQQTELLATVSGLVFGFLTDIAVTYEFPSMIGRILVAIALLFIATAIGIFLLPLLYEHYTFRWMSRRKCSSTCGATSSYYTDLYYSSRAYIAPCGFLCTDSSNGLPLSSRQS